MKKYIRIYKCFLNNAISYLAAYRRDTWISLFLTLLWIGMMYLVIEILFQYTSSLGSWNKGEVYLLTTLWIIVDEVNIMFFGANLQNIPDKVTEGDLDFYLTKPAPTLFLISVEYIHLRAFYRLVPEIALLIFLWNSFAIPFFWLNFLATLVLIIFALGVLYAVSLIINTFSFWFYRIDNSNSAWFVFHNLGRFPIDILPKTIRVILLTVIPIAYTAYFPTLALTGKLAWYHVLWTGLFSCILICIAYRFWKYALRSYSSASS